MIEHRAAQDSFKEQNCGPKIDPEEANAKDVYQVNQPQILIAQDAVKQKGPQRKLSDAVEAAGKCAIVEESKAEHPVVNDVPDTTPNDAVVVQPQRPNSRESLRQQ